MQVEIAKEVLTLQLQRLLMVEKLHERSKKHYLKMFDYNSFSNAVIKANKELYEYINTHMSSFDLEESNTIGYGGDNSLRIDLFAEEIFIKHLDKFGDIYSEEIGLVSSNSNIKIIIDPIDGSHNFQSQLPYYGTSVALEIDGITKAGFVCNLANGQLIYKTNGEIKTINIEDGSEILSLKIKESSIGIFERSYAYPEICQKLYENRIKYRSPGAAALSLAYAHNVSFVLFMGKIREFDIAAALYISSDLFIHQEDEFLIVTKSKQFLSQIKEIIKNNRL